MKTKIGYSLGTTGTLFAFFFSLTPSVLGQTNHQEKVLIPYGEFTM